MFVKQSGLCDRYNLIRAGHQSERKKGELLHSTRTDTQLSPFKGKDYRNLLHNPLVGIGELFASSCELQLVSVLVEKWKA